ncbi:hypothetical protein ACLOJK_039956 [Asimina triloba]
MDQITNLFSEDFVRGFSSGEAAGSFEHGPSSSFLPRSQYLPPSPGMPSAPFITDPSQPVPPSFQPTPPESSSLLPHQQAMQVHGQAHNIRLPTPADDDAAMARAILAVLSSHSTLLSSHQTQQTQTPQHQIRDGTGAFKPYSPALNPMIGTRTSSDGQHRMKLVFAILRSIFSTSSEPWVQAQRRSSQLHHIIGERRRRGRMNEEFQELIRLLPNVPKKERVSRVSVLNATREYLRGLQAQVEEMREKNQALETQAAGRREEDEITDIDQTERVTVEAVEASSSEERQVEVRVRVVMEDERGMAALVLRVLERLKQMNGVSLASMEADTQLHQARRWNRLILRLKVKTATNKRLPPHPIFKLASTSVELMICNPGYIKMATSHASPGAGSGTWDDQSIKEAMNDAVFNEAP